ncbi:sulfatase [Natrialba sp. PRR66]|uniref:sulfatase n=1 Tax=Natrialba sp. PRR66 TaxID=3098146 RepID=UPI002B1D9E85|nr:sulfatase [Natrialba sp. PRR66]
MAEQTQRESNSGELESHSTVRNVVLVVLDTARARRVAGDWNRTDENEWDEDNRAAATDDRTTPELHRLAETGTTFENAFATAPWTLPSHASMFTGLYASEHGTHGDHTYLDSDLRTLPEAFDDAGFETIGVSNNTWITEEFGFDRGFDDLRKGWQYIQSETDMGTVVRGEDLHEKLRATRNRLFDGNPVVNAANILYSELFQPAGDDGASRSADWVENWLATRDDDRPFFLFCNFIEPHVEYNPPREFAERFLPADATYEEATAIRQDPRAYDCEDYEITDREFTLLRGLYRASLAYADAQVGRLREALETNDEWEDTLVVVCGDHGEHVGDHGFFGHQYNLYDTLLNVPLVCHGGPFVGGDRRSELVQLLDVPLTVLEAAGVDDPELREQATGYSLYPGSTPDAPSPGATSAATTAATGTPKPDATAPAAAPNSRDAVFAEYVAPQPSIDRLEARFDDVPDRVREFDRRLRAIRTSEYKYVRGDDGFERLHHVETDPHERTDISDAEPETVRRLRQRLEDEFEPLGESVSTGEVAMREGTKERLADLGYL